MKNRIQAPPARVGRASIMLTETLIAVLFFSLASVICIQIFVQTHEINRRAGAIDFAVTQAASAADLLEQGIRDGEILAFQDGKAVEGQEEECAFLAVLPGAAGLSEDMETVFYYDKDLAASSQAEARYRMSISKETEEELSFVAYHIIFTDLEETDSDKALLYELETGIHQPLGEEAA